MRTTSREFWRASASRSSRPIKLNRRRRSKPQANEAGPGLGCSGPFSLKRGDGMGNAPLQVRDFDAALAVVMEHAARAKAPAAERVGLSASLGRVLAQEVRADRDQPPFDRSTRDGFAVRAAEIAAGLAVRVAGQVRAGEPWRCGAIEAGGCVEIMTGAPLPPGMDAVVMVEHVERTGAAIRLAQGRGFEP